MTADIIITISTLNRNLHSLVAFYKKTAWNIDVFLSTRFPNSRAVRQALDEYDGILAGPAAYHFFNRSRLPANSDIEILVGYAGIRGMGYFLMSSGYSFWPDIGNGDFRDFPTTIMSFSTVSRMRTRCHHHLRFPVIRSFRFYRVLAGHPQSLRLTLMGYDVLHYILMAPSTKLMSFITGRYALSVFPKSTYGLYVQFMCHYSGYHGDAVYRWGRELRHTRHTVIEAGTEGPWETWSRLRAVGDESSWIFWFDAPVNERLLPIKYLSQFHQKFQISNWMVAPQEPEEYMVISEPGLTSFDDIDAAPLA
ncbi:hypothetical protein BJ138DRAFT_1114895 [Hygrophoropsis aurantiaca]|uniref:Uncharacterized protein n=1 Tax=Hygrophoropsis aurantiaca TaxID=72124 RepID=A0ACB8A8Y2_9AGAM|nr:hypothetical protein BJ138DRAFT_1114895 [Hygrophoropsis aurantiaca]